MEQLEGVQVFCVSVIVFLSFWFYKVFIKFRKNTMNLGLQIETIVELFILFLHWMHLCFNLTGPYSFVGELVICHLNDEFVDLFEELKEALDQRLEVIL